MGRAPQPRQGPGAAPRSQGQVPNRTLVFDRFTKMNTKVMRQNLLEEEAAWIENLQPIAPNDLKVVPGPQMPSLAELGGSPIVRMFFGNIDPNDFIVAFTQGGGGYAILVNTGEVINFAPEWTFSTKPDMTVWAAQRFLIIDEQAGYSTWDTTAFITNGGLSPNVVITNGGSGYSSPPSVGFVGGNGTGAAATAVVQNGSVVGITVTNGGTGYLAGDQVTVAIGSPGNIADATGTIGVAPNGGLDSATFHVTNGGGPFPVTPEATFTGGTGSGAIGNGLLNAAGQVVGLALQHAGTGYTTGQTVNVTFTDTSGGGTGATATINVMPQIFGTTLDVAFGRVWIGSGRLLTFTGVAGFDDLDPANAAGSTTITDYDLVHSITAIRNRNNLLFIFGDQSVRIIGDISVQQSVTLFTPVTLASDIGTSFLMTIVSYNRLLFFANKHGVYGIFGSTVQKVSDDLDGIFIRTDFSIEPSAALNDVNNIHCYLLLLRYNDPVRGPRAIICVFQQSQAATWWVTSQGDSLTAIVWAPLQSTLLIQTFGTSYRDITWLLEDDTVIMPVKLQTSLSRADDPLLAKVAIRAGIAAYSQIIQVQDFTLDTENRLNPYTLTTRAGQFFFPYTSVDGYGKFLGATLQFQAVNYNLNAVAIEYQDADIWGILPEAS